jgi:hypothetical protein
MEKYMLGNLYVFEKQFFTNKKSKLVIGEFKRGNLIVAGLLNFGPATSPIDPITYSRDELGRLISIRNFLIRKSFVDKELLNDQYLNLFDFMRKYEDAFDSNFNMYRYLNYRKDSMILKSDIEEIEVYMNKVKHLLK